AWNGFRRCRSSSARTVLARATAYHLLVNVRCNCTQRCSRGEHGRANPPSRISHADIEIAADAGCELAEGLRPRLNELREGLLLRCAHAQHLANQRELRAGELDANEG